MKPDKIRRRLARALADGAMVRLKRTVEAYATYGYIVGLGPEWLLLRHFYDARFQDWEALRVDDLTSARFDRTFLPELLRRRGENTASPPPIHLDDLNALLASVAAHFPIVCLALDF